jgi:hypothetical protein
MISFTIAPGEGLPVRIVYPDDAAGYTFTASVYDPASEAKVADLAVASVDTNTWEADITGTQSATWKGRRLIGRAVAVDPARASLPMVDEFEVTVRRV